MDSYPFVRREKILSDNSWFLFRNVWRNLKNINFYPIYPIYSSLSIRISSSKISLKERKEKKREKNYRPTPRFILVHISSTGKQVEVHATRLVLNEGRANKDLHRLRRVLRR